MTTVLGLDHHPDAMIDLILTWLSHGVEGHRHPELPKRARWPARDAAHHDHISRESTGTTTHEEHPSVLAPLVDLGHRYLRRPQEEARLRLVKGLLLGRTDRIMHYVMTERRQLDQPPDPTMVSELRLLALARIALLLLLKHQLVVHHLHRSQCQHTICRAVQVRRLTHVAAFVVEEVLRRQADVNILLETILHVVGMLRPSDVEVLLMIAHQLVKATILVQAMIHALHRLLSVLVSRSMAPVGPTLRRCFAHRTARQPPIHGLNVSTHSWEMSRR
jgi:hypothetical protein